jgi:glucose-1-phosphate thymidylyltransferase
VSRLIGVLPAAGTAERLQPISGSKEVLALGGRPVLDYAVERLRAARPDEIRVVVRPDKADVTERARVLALEVVEARPRNLAESIVAGIAPLADEDAVIVDLPDSLWGPVDGFDVLLRKLETETDVVLAIFRSAEPERGDVVELPAEDRVVAVHVKSPDPPGDWVWGAFAARVGVLRALERYRDPGHCFDDLARRGRVRAVRFPGEFIDIGTKEALARARELLGT